MEEDVKVAPLPGVTRKNIFRFGDVAKHSKHGYVGDVIAVNGKWVTIRVFGKTAPGGKPFTQRFAYGKLVLVMNLDKRKELAGKYAAKMQEMQKNNTPVRRAAAWLRNLVKPKQATASAA